ncbi:MAG: hypothetical protein M3295_06590, partial [Chloroflexota bacterium]|nr:hypothetical protein [Chloroflexota bacterium]
VLPQTTDDAHRTWVFTVYNLVGNLSGAVGSLAAALVGIFATIGLRGADAYRPLLVLYAAIGLANLLSSPRCRRASSGRASRASAGSWGSIGPAAPWPGCPRCSRWTRSPAGSW